MGNRLLSHSLGDGQMTLEQHAALVAYAKANGRTWKAKLREDWMSARIPEGAALRALRNEIGPTGLTRLRVVGDSVLA